VFPTDEVSLTRTVHLRPRTTADESFLFALFYEQRAPEFALAGLSRSALDGVVRQQFQLQETSYRLNRPRAQDAVIWVGADRIGRMWVDRSGDHLHLLDVAIVGPVRGQGIGTALIEELLAEAAASGRPLRLWVRRYSRAANLYQRLGFTVVEDNGTDLKMEKRPSAPAQHNPALA
jgi:GNAT superfamily N-acetyltransferase